VLLTGFQYAAQSNLNKSFIFHAAKYTHYNVLGVSPVLNADFNPKPQGLTSLVKKTYTKIYLKSIFFIPRIVGIY